MESAGHSTEGIQAFTGEIGAGARLVELGWSRVSPRLCEGLLASEPVE
jgi:hypothetical protein